MAEENVSIRLINMENEMKQVFTFLQQLSKQVEHLSVRLDQLTVTPLRHPRPEVMIQMEPFSVNPKDKLVIADNILKSPDPKELSTIRPKFMQHEQYKFDIIVRVTPSQRQNNKKQFTPLLGFLSQVLAILRKKGLLSIEPTRPNPENFSNYDPSEKCDYHVGEVGHSTDDCHTLKLQIQSLLDKKSFSFQTGGGHGCKPA